MRCWASCMHNGLGPNERMREEGTVRRIERMQQSSAIPKNQRCRDWFAEDSCILSILLAVPSCIYSFWHGVIPTSYFIFNDFYTCFTNFLCRLSLECNNSTVQRDNNPRTYTCIHTYAHAYCAPELQQKL